MTEVDPLEKTDWVQVEKDPIYREVIFWALILALGVIMFYRQRIRLPDGASTLGQGLTCTVLLSVIVIFLAFINWKVRKVRTDAIMRFSMVPWKQVTKMIEEVLMKGSIEYEMDAKGWRGPSYNWASGMFRQVYHLPREHLRIYVVSRDARGTGKLRHPTKLSIGPVNDDTRAFANRLTDWLDEAFAERDDDS